MSHLWLALGVSYNIELTVCMQGQAGVVEQRDRWGSDILPSVTHNQRFKAASSS